MVQEVDGHEFDGAELAVDATDELVDDGAQVLVLLDVLARGHRYLHEDNLADPLGVLRQEDLEGVEFLRDALDVVQPVDADNQLDALELAREGGDALLDLGLLEALDELFGIDTNGEGTNSDKFAIIIDTVRGGWCLAVKLLVQV